mgnify:CR=1 FL=1
MARSMPFSRAAAPAALIVILLASGCASRQEAASGPPQEPLPDWVRVVPTTAQGKAYYVGGCSMAVTLEAGLEMAEGDALSQLESEAREHMREIVGNAQRGSDIDITSTERGRLRMQAGTALADALIEAAERESTFHRDCGGEEGGAVCQIFALLTVPLEEWDRQVLRVLTAEAAGAREEGQPARAELAEFTARYYVPRAGESR